ncbi:hypothetical protein, partial [Methylomagnum sp.]
RLHGNLPFAEAGPFVLVDDDGERRVSERAVTVDGRPYRRVRGELKTPTRDGDDCLDLLSDLPPGIPATTLAALYRRR